MVFIGSNSASAAARRMLDNASSSLARSYERLSSGLRINRASDDAAGLAVSTALKSDSRVFAQAIRNVNDGISLLNIASSALEQLSLISVRQQELAEQAANGSYSLVQRQALGKEVTQLVHEFNRITATVQFNGRNLLSPSASQTSLQLGYGPEGSISFNTTGNLERKAGDGTFDAAVTYQGAAVGTGHTADVNGDGILDILMGDATLTRLFVLLGNGDGSFKARVTYSSAAPPNFILTNDFNNDGAVDIIQFGTSGSFALLVGNGDGTFKAPVYQFAGNNLLLAAAGDFNGDGNIDFISPENGSPVVNVMLGNGNGTFKHQAFATAGNPNSVQIADFNNDGRMDLAMTIGSSLNVFLGNGNGSFSSGITVDSPYTLGAFQIGDFNFDGIADLAATSPADSSIRISFGNGDGSFKAGAGYGNAAYTSLNKADLNGDGVMDLVAQSGGSVMSIFYGSPDGTFAAPVSSVMPAFSTFADLNGDGVQDHVRLQSTVSISLGKSTAVTSSQFFNIATQSGALQALENIKRNIDRVSMQIGSLGASQSRLETALNHLGATRENYEAAAGRITDADMAEEAANLVRVQILERTAAAVLAQANLGPSLALKLLQIKPSEK